MKNWTSDEWVDVLVFAGFGIAIACLGLAVLVVAVAAVVNG
jgi:hypothetical protein